MVATSDGWGPVPPHHHVASATTGPVGFQTWSIPNVVLSILNNDKAIINVDAPWKPCMLSLVLSVLNKHGIDAVSAQVSADSTGSFFTE
nr:unnamed protein product [Digitaria exilis]